MNLSKINLSWVLALACLMVASVSIPVVQGDPASGLNISRLWARATPPGVKMGAVYLDITNDQEESIELIGVSTPVADRAEVHESFTVDGMMKMRRKENLAFPTGKQVRFAPGGLHIMLMGLKVPLVAGEEFQLTLHFQGQPDLILQVPVMPVTQATYPE